MKASRAITYFAMAISSGRVSYQWISGVINKGGLIPVGDFDLITASRLRRHVVPSIKYHFRHCKLISIRIDLENITWLFLPGTT